VPFQVIEPQPPLVPGDTVKGALSPGDVINARVNGINFGGYSYYSSSTWRFTVGMSEDSEKKLAEIENLSLVLYDSLAVKRIRGIERRPFGPALDRGELLPFWRLVNPWYESLRDSMMSVSGLREVVAETDSPASYLDTFARVLAAEVPVEGDVFLVETSKPFDRDDVLRFTVAGGEMTTDVPEDLLENIYVVPDPYIAVNNLESRNLFLSGRGERRIDFRNLPAVCNISIYTMSGRLVKVIEHNAPDEQSIASWNLQSDDGLDVSYGVYIFHVDAPGIGEKVGRFAIIK
jgi:hypothetical protein